MSSRRSTVEWAASAVHWAQSTSSQ
uniref:Uncharacterized protein n=1 Tax=Arundo donax TaxID=35708 RepID=A0A0A8YWS4_ARUDO